MYQMVVRPDHMFPLTTVSKLSWHMHLLYWAIYLISPGSPIYASVTCVSIDSCNGLSPIRRQAITWTNADLLSTKIKTQFSIHENAFENVV